MGGSDSNSERDWARDSIRQSLRGMVTDVSWEDEGETLILHYADGRSYRFSACGVWCGFFIQGPGIVTENPKYAHSEVT